jgi:Probable N6-adenine methyltransferase
VWHARTRQSAQLTRDREGPDPLVSPSMEHPPARSAVSGVPWVSQNKDADYLARLSHELLGALSGQRPKTLTQLLRAGQGATPDVVLNLLAGVFEADQLPTAVLESVGYPEVPELHPLLFEWYFDAPSVRFIAEVVMGAGHNILCLGTPSVANYLAGAQGRPRVTLVDADPGVPHRFPELQRADVHVGELDSFVGSTDYSVVVADPPWYLADTLRWLRTAHQRVRQGGTIILPLFPDLTRPEASAERATIFAAAERIGRAELWARKVVYRTPGFEQQAFRALGLPETGDWRTADLLVVRQVHGHAKLGVPNRTHRGLEGWRRFEIGAQVVMLRELETSPHDASVFLPIAGCPRNTLTSVSERDPRRALVGLWTSRNRVAAVGNVREAARLLSHFAGESQELPREALSAWMFLQDLLVTA